MELSSDHYMTKFHDYISFDLYIAYNLWKIIIPPTLEFLFVLTQPFC